MEFPFDVSNVLYGRITVVESNNTNSNLKIYDLNNESDNKCYDGSWTYFPTQNVNWDVKLRKKKEDLETIINRLGDASAKAQELLSPITTIKRLLDSDHQKVYIIRDVDQTSSVIGMLKVGIKCLFVYNDTGAQQEVNPLCILDFYIHESMQRCGLGHELFDAMLKAEHAIPTQLAIDRPSDKCLAFLQKHYGLQFPVQQNNNFVIYQGFLQNYEVTRPPIFLYCEKTYKGSVSESNFSSRKKIDSARAFENVSLTSLRNRSAQSERKYSVSEMNLKTSSHLANFYKKNSGGQRNHRSIQESLVDHRNECLDNWNNHAECTLTPVNIEQSFRRQRWKELQSSWNVLGVKPMDYTVPRH